MINIPKVITLGSFKGGTGKTLLTYNIVSMLATEYNQRVLVIDADPQHNSTHLLLNESYDSHRGIETIFKQDLKNEYCKLSSVVYQSNIQGINIIPSSIELIRTESEAQSMFGKEFVLLRWIKDNLEDLSYYDYIFIDTNPTMGITNINSYLSSDSILLITDIDADSIIAIDTFMSSYLPILEKVGGRESNIKGIIVNKLKETTNLDRDFIEYIESDTYPHRNLVVPAYIHDAVALRETKALNKPIASDRNERAYNEIRGLIDVLYEKGVL